MKTVLVRYCSVIVVLVPFVANSQSMSDLGMIGGSGAALTPTIAVTPESHFRLSVTRVGLLQRGADALDDVGVTSGLSSNMEFTAKFQSVESRANLAPTFVGFGAKFVIPANLPMDSRAAFWADVDLTANGHSESIFSSQINRWMIVVQPQWLRGFNGNVLIGTTASDGGQRFAVGSNVSWIVNGFIKLGGEVQYNYYGISDVHESGLVILRLHPNVFLQASPGYLKSPVLTSWMMSVGVSLSTASVDFVAPDKTIRKNDVVPSFDEMEKQIQQEKGKEK